MHVCYNVQFQSFIHTQPYFIIHEVYSVPAFLQPAVAGAVMVVVAVDTHNSRYEERYFPNYYY